MENHGSGDNWDPHRLRKEEQGMELPGFQRLTANGVSSDLGSHGANPKTFAADAFVCSLCRRCEHPPQLFGGTHGTGVERQAAPFWSEVVRKGGKGRQGGTAQPTESSGGVGNDNYWLPLQHESQRRIPAPGEYNQSHSAQRGVLYLFSLLFQPKDVLYLHF